MTYESRFETARKNAQMLVKMQSDREGNQEAFRHFNGKCGELENIFIDWKLSIDDHYYRMMTRDIINLANDYEYLLDRSKKENITETLSQFIDKNVKVRMREHFIPEKNDSEKLNAECQKLFEALNAYNDKNLKQDANPIVDKIQQLRGSSLGNSDNGKKPKKD